MYDTTNADEFYIKNFHQIEKFLRWSGYKDTPAMTVADRVHDAFYTILSRNSLTKWDRRKSFKNYIMQAVTWSIKRKDSTIQNEEECEIDLSRIHEFREFLQKKYSQELVDYLNMIVSCGERHAEKYPQLYREYRVALEHFLSL